MPSLNPPTHSRNKFICLAVVICVVFSAFFTCLKNDFVNWDDDKYILNNSYIKSLSREDIKDIFTNTVNRMYVPLTIVSFAVEYHFFEESPFVYHLNNVLLHILVTAFVFAFCLQLKLSIRAAMLAALLFGIHPMRVESVAWITERKDVLYAFFYMLALCSYLRYLHTQKITPYLLTIVLGFLSMLAKPMALSLPLILLLCDWFCRRKFTAKVFVEKIPYFLFIVPIAWVTYADSPHLLNRNILEAFLVWSWTFVFYLKKFIWPYPLVAIYRLPQPIAFNNAEYLAAVIILTLVLLLLWRFRKSRWFIFAWAFYLFSIFAVLRYEWEVCTTIVADRFMYLASIGFCILVALFGENIWGYLRRQKIAYRVLGIFTFLGVVVALLVVTISQCLVWHNGATLWKHQLRYYPEEPFALNNLAMVYSKSEEYQAALDKYLAFIASVDVRDDYNAHLRYFQNEKDMFVKVIRLYQRSIALDPRYAAPYYNLGNIYYHDIGNYEAAMRYYQKTLSLRENFEDTRYNLAKIYMKSGKAREAVAEFEKMVSDDSIDEPAYVRVVDAYNEAIRRGQSVDVYRAAQKRIIVKYKDAIDKKPPRASSYFNLGYMHHKAGERQEAIVAYERALEINPRHTDALYDLGNAYREIGNVNKAVSLYLEAVRLAPSYEDAYLHLGISYALLEDYEKAIEYNKKLIELNPKHANAHFNMGYVYATMGRNAEAIEEYEKVVSIDPKHAEGYFSLGNMYALLGLSSKAEGFYLKTVKVNPGHMDAFVNLSTLYYYRLDFKKALEYCREAQRLGYKAPAEYLQALEKYQN